MNLDLADAHITEANGIKSTSNATTASTRIADELKTWKQQPPPSFPSRGLRDVTANFVAASKQLRPGELVKDEYFTLFEAVGALEVIHLPL